MRERLKKLYSSSDWKEAEASLAEEWGLAVSPSTDRTLELDERDIGNSDFELGDVSSIFKSDESLVKRFSLAWYKDCIKNDYGEEYDPDEGDQQAGLDRTGKNITMCEGFLVNHTMFLLYAKYSPEKILAYLKRRRIPHAAKVCRDVVRIFKSVNEHDD